MAGRVTEVTAVVALASVMTLLIAAPVLRAPSERVFGAAIVGRHHDPFTVMEQFQRPFQVGLYSQPLTDAPGSWLATATGPVAAYNWLVLVTFPLSAGAAFLLARHLHLSPSAAALAALAYAFSPFHLAQAAYHPHVAQTQWLPLYLLALFRCLDAPSAAAAGWLGAATVAVTLSNFYGGLIAAVITPVAVAVYWWVHRERLATHGRDLRVTLGALALLAAIGVAYAMSAAPATLFDRASLAFPRDDLFLYSAKWWSYLVPPVAHPLLGATVQRLWDGVGVHEGLLEQQVALGWGLVALSAVTVFGWLSARARGRALFGLTPVPVLTVIALVALVCSLSPERTIGSIRFVRPSALLYAVVPMFRSYGRFGNVVQLMTALLAGIGVDYLRRTGAWWGHAAWLVLVAAVVAEYAVAPSAMWRDVLPTPAHRWLASQPGRIHALDCTAFTQESASVVWLTGGKVALEDALTEDCEEPDLSSKLAALGFTHLIVRREAGDPTWLEVRPTPLGLRMEARFDGARVYAVTMPPPLVYTSTMTGFSGREANPAWSWRWMGSDASWTVVRTGTKPAIATLGLELSAFHHARHMEVWLDGRPVKTLLVEPPRGTYVIGPLTLSAGAHELAFHPTEPAERADAVVGNGDRRWLSYAFGAWTWTAREVQP